MLYKTSFLLLRSKSVLFCHTFGVAKSATLILFPDCFHRGRLRRKWSTRFAKQSGRLYIVHHVVVHVRARVRTYVGVVAAAIDVVAAHHDVDVAPSLASN